MSPRKREKAVQGREKKERESKSWPCRHPPHRASGQQPWRQQRQAAGQVGPAAGGKGAALVRRRGAESKDRHVSFEFLEMHNFYYASKYISYLDA